MLVVHLFVSYVHANRVTFSLPPGVRGWLRLLLVVLPGLFCWPFSIFLEFCPLQLISEIIVSTVERFCIPLLL